MPQRSITSIIAAFTLLSFNSCVHIDRAKEGFLRPFRAIDKSLVHFGDKLYENMLNSREEQLKRKGYYVYRGNDYSPPIIAIQGTNSITTNVVMGDFSLLFSYVPLKKDVGALANLQLRICRVNVELGQETFEVCREAKYCELEQERDIYDNLVFSYRTSPASTLGKSGIYQYEWWSDEVKSSLAFNWKHALYIAAPPLSLFARDENLLMEGRFVLK